MVGGRQRGKSREKGGRVGVPAKVERGRVPSRIRFRVPVALMTAILPPLAPLTLPCPTIAPLPSSHHRGSHPSLRGDAPCLPPTPSLSLSLSPSLSFSFSTLHAIHIQDDSNYVTTSRTCDLFSSFPFPPSLSLTPSRKGTYRFTSTDPTPPRFPCCPAAGYTVYTRYM